MVEQKDINSTVGKVENAAHQKDGAAGALKALTEDLNKYGNDPEAVSAITKQFKTADPTLLHELELEWGKEQIGKGKLASHDLTQDNLKSVEDSKNTQYNALDRQMAQGLLDNFDSLKTREGGFLGMFKHDGISAKTLDQKITSDNNAIGQMRPQDVAANLAKVELNSTSASGILDTVRALPQADQQVLSADGSTISQNSVKQVLANDAKGHELTDNQRAVLQNLDANWDTMVGNGKNLTVENLFKAVSSKGDATDGQNQFVKAANQEDTSIKQWAASMSQDAANQNSDFYKTLDANHNIDRQKLADVLAAEQKANKVDPALATLAGQFDAISHDGKTISQADYHEFLQSHGALDASKPQDSTAPNGSDNPNSPTEKAKDAFDHLPQELTLGKDGNVLYDLAQQSLEARAKLTGEPVNSDAIMREVNRIMQVNGYPAADLQGKTHITMHDLPAAWNHVRRGQVFKLYNADEQASLEKAIAARMQPTPQAAPEAAPRASSSGGNYNEYGDTPPQPAPNRPVGGAGSYNQYGDTPPQQPPTRQIRPGANVRADYVSPDQTNEQTQLASNDTVGDGSGSNYG